MKCVFWTFLAVAAHALAAHSAPLYLKAGAAGDGSGSSWANACTTFDAAIEKLNVAAEGDRTLLVAQGTYVLTKSNSVSVAGFLIQGGYRAAEDGDLERDPAEYQSIFTPDTDANDHVRPVRVDPYASSQPAINNINVVVNGKVNMPEEPYPDTGDYGAYILFNQGGKNTVYYFLVVDPGASGTIDGIVLCGMNQNAGAGIFVDTGAGDVTISNCTFAYNIGDSRSEVKMSAANGALRRITGCTFFGNAHNWTPVVSAAGGLEMTDCTFSSDSSSAAKTGHCLVLSGTDNLVKNCTFRRLSAVFPGGFATSANICYMASGDVVFDGCTFDHCHTAPSAVGVQNNPSLFTLLGGGTMTNCTFAGCRTTAYAAKNGVYGLIAPSQTGAHTLNVLGCSFVGNAVFATPQTTEGCNYVMGVVGNGFNGQSTIVKNCIFDGNTFGWVPVDGVAPLVARSAFTLATAANSQSKLTFVNNTVTGARQPGTYDIVQLGGGHAQALTVWNSIFTSSDWVHQDGFYADQPALWDVRSCTIKNLTEVYWPQDVDVSSGLGFDDIPLAADYTPAARVPGIRATTDGSVRGAVNALTEVAENGYTLTVRAAPVGNAVLSSPSTQAVPSGGQTVPVAAAVAGGASVLGWYDEEDRLVTENATLPAQTLAADKVVTVKFGMPRVEFTFDLGQCGTFAESGTPQASVIASVGEAFPGIPEYRIDTDNWVFQGWDKEVPTVMPGTGMSFSARYVTRQLRQIRVVPSHDGPVSEDGLSWETAYTDIGAAYRDAAAYQGEVWLMAGSYTLAASIPMLSRVKVIGGFAGGETSADEADPAANDTVVTIQGAAFYADSGTVEDAKFYGIHFKDVKNSAIRVNGATVTGLEIEKCVFEKCNTAKASDFGPVGVKACAVTLKDCDFINSYHCVYSTGTTAGMTMTVDGCRFVGNDGQNYGTCVYAESKGALTVRNTCFEANTNTTHNCSGSATMTIWTDGPNLVEDCMFVSNVVAGTCQANVLMNSSATFERCNFIGNRLAAKNNSGTSHSATIHTGSQRTTVKDCYFGQNVVSTPAAASYRSVFYIGANQVVCLNCTFDRNVVERAEGDTGVTALMQFFGHNQGVALAHCTIADTVLPTGCAEIDCHGTDATSYQNCALSFVNTILWNEAADYNPVDVAGKDIPLWVQNAVVKNMDTDQYVKLVVCTNLVADADPVLAQTVRAGDNGVLARPLNGSTIFRKSGCKTWYNAATGFAYAYNPASKKYLCLSKASSTGLPSGLTANDPPPADAWGQPRREARISLGAVNAYPGSTRLIVR